MGFKIICVCNCGHKLKAKSPIFEESQYSVTGFPPQSEFCAPSALFLLSALVIDEQLVVTLLL
ncbi:MAG: hypothetical protein WAJ93_18210 [Candidatus Nitrosopolaris sp.]